MNSGVYVPPIRKGVRGTMLGARIELELQASDTNLWALDDSGPAVSGYVNLQKDGFGE